MLCEGCAGKCPRRAVTLTTSPPHLTGTGATTRDTAATSSSPIRLLSNAISPIANDNFSRGSLSGSMTSNLRSHPLILTLHRLPIFRLILKHPHQHCHQRHHFQLACRSPPRRRLHQAFPPRQPLRLYRTLLSTRFPGSLNGWTLQISKGAPAARVQQTGEARAVEVRLRMS